MMQPEVRAYLYDLRKACTLIESFVAGKTFEDYRTDALLRSAVERQFSIIGEALNQMFRVAPELKGHISEATDIIGFRNWLVHGYASVSDEIVWGAATSRLARLQREIEHLISHG